jgi:hypothetical protein
MSVSIGKGVKTIHQNAFNGCHSLLNFSVSSLNSYYKAVSGSLYSKDGTSLVKYATGKNDSTFVIPEGVTTLGINSLSYAENLTSIKISASVKTISANAFESCYNLLSFEVDENNSYFKAIDGILYSKDGKTLVKYAIGKKDTSFVISETVNKINSYAFSDATNLLGIVVGDNVQQIGSYAFYRCTNLASVTLGKSVSYIAKNALYSCSSLGSVVIPQSVTRIESDVFGMCESLVSVTFEDTSTWYVTTNYDFSYGSERDVSDPIENAKYMVEFSDVKFYKK